METVYINNINEKVSIPRLKTDLRELGEKHGTVIDVFAKRGIRMRGQAFIVFASPEDAQAAVDALAQHEYHGKPFHTALARTRSDVSLAPEEVEQRQQARKARQQPIGEAQTTKAQATKKRVAGEDPIQKRARIDFGEPHNILFVQNLPGDTTSELLGESFKQLAGFVEARVFAARGVGFVEFKEVANAAAAISTKLEIKGHEPLVTYAKK